MRMREAVIAGLPLYSPRLCSPDLPRLLSCCFHSEREEPACLDARGEKLNGLRKRARLGLSTSIFTTWHKDPKNY